MIPEVYKIILDAMYKVLDNNALFIGRDELYSAMKLVEREFDLSQTIMADTDATHIAQHIMIDAMRPLPLTDELRQHIVQSTQLYDASPRA